MERSASAAGGGFLDLLRLRTEVVDRIVGPTPADDAPLLAVVADLERRMIASPPRTPVELIAGLGFVGSEIRDGYLSTDTVEEMLGAIVAAATDFVAGHTIQRS